MTALHVFQSLAMQPSLKPHYKALADDLLREAAARQRFRASLSKEAENGRVEFIEGEAVKQMSIQLRHVQAVQNTVTLASTYARLKRLGMVHSEQSLTAFPRNDFLPDVCFWKKAKSKHFIPDQLIYPAPDFAVEVLSPSTERVDRGVKFRDYEANGVSEYWILDPVAQSIEQYVLRDGRCELIGRFFKGGVRSYALKGFEMPVRAAFDDAENLAALRRLLAK